jgi:hypothetical protein
MKGQTSLIAMWLVVATTAVGFATLGDMPKARPREDASSLHQTQTIVAADLPGRAHCYNGMKAGKGNLYRGWMCEPEHPALSAN